MDRILLGRLEVFQGRLLEGTFFLSAVVLCVLYGFSHQQEWSLLLTLSRLGTQHRPLPAGQIGLLFRYSFRRRSVPSLRQSSQRLKSGPSWGDGVRSSGTFRRPCLSFEAVSSTFCGSLRLCIPGCMAAPLVRFSVLLKSECPYARIIRR